MFIYCLYSSQPSNRVYIGSTKGYLSMRKAQHKYCYKKFLRGETTFISSTKILEHCETDEDLKIQLLEEILDETREAEDWWIAHFKDIGMEVVNCNDAVHSKEKYLEALKIKYHQQKGEGKIPSALSYYYKNREAILEKRKAYYLKTKTTSIA